MTLIKTSNLTLECTGIGSLPHQDVQLAMDIVDKYSSDVPFWPQLMKFNKNEDMLVQYLENMPSFFIDSVSGRKYFDCENENFEKILEQFLIDYDEIVNSESLTILNKYGISSEYSKTINDFLTFLKDKKPQYAKGQIVGPFTLSMVLADKSGEMAVKNKVLRNIITKTLVLKAIWQIRKIKSVSPNTVPIIFVDEPSLSRSNPNSEPKAKVEDVVDMIEEVASMIKKEGGICALHCCGKCDWSIPLRASVDIINLDAFNYSRHLALYSKEIKEFLDNNGKIAWGIIPTVSDEILDKYNVEDFENLFKQAVKYLTNEGIDEKIIIQNSLITTSCGAGRLSEPYAIKAMSLTKELSDKLKKDYLMR